MKILLLFIFFITAAYAIPEQQFSEVYYTHALVDFEQLPTQSFINNKSRQIFYTTFKKSGNSKAIVILPGRSEPRIKYAEFFYDLRDAGFDLYIIDHAGQGESHRLLNDPQRGYVRRFDDYVRDFAKFMDEIVITQTGHQQLYLLAHSMGGTIATNYLAHYIHPIKKALLSAPMMQVNTAPYTEKTARFLTALLVGVGQGKKYAPDRGPYIANDDTFDLNDVTSSLERFQANKYIFVNFPALVIGGPTSRWVLESLKATKNIHKLNSKIKIPLMLFQAGKDQIVFPGKQDEFCQMSNCQKIVFKESQHEIFQEKDFIRDPAMKLMMDFFK